MADPLSIAGSVAGLFALAAAVGKQLKATYQTFSEANTSLGRISNEVEHITLVVHELKIYLSAAPQDYPCPSHNLLLASAIPDTNGTLERIRMALSQLQSSDSSVRKWKRIRWVWEQHATDQLIESLQRQKNSLILCILMLNMYVHRYFNGVNKKTAVG